MSRTWKRQIPQGKYDRVKKDRASQVVNQIGTTIVPVTRFYAFFKKCNSYVLGQFMYTKEVNPETGQTEYFRYRIKPQEAFTIDQGYFEYRLQRIEREVEITPTGMNL